MKTETRSNSPEAKLIAESIAEQLNKAKSAQDLLDEVILEEK